LIAEINDERVLIDWKCTKKPSEAWHIQGNGYAQLFENAHENMIDKIIFVRLDIDGNDPEVIEIEKDGNLFANAFEFYHRFFKDQKCNLELE